MAVRCAECGGEMGSWEKRNVPYECGLPGVELRNLDVTTCKNCGAWEARIPDVEGLHHALAARVARSPEPLNPAEIKFLRKFLGWSGRDFADAVGYRPETVSRWENGHNEMPLVVDRLLRAYATLGKPIADYREHDEVSREHGVPVAFELTKDHWSVTAA